MVLIRGSTVIFRTDNKLHEDKREHSVIKKKAKQTMLQMRDSRSGKNSSKCARQEKKFVQDAQKDFFQKVGCSTNINSVDELSEGTEESLNDQHEKKNSFAFSKYLHADRCETLQQDT